LKLAGHITGWFTFADRNLNLMKQKYNKNLLISNIGHFYRELPL
jgi:hypothetical protein